MFKRWRADRSAARQWLLVRPASDASGSWQWRRLPGTESGHWPPPAHSAQEAVALIMPAAQCSHFQVPAPPGLKPHEWPQLLEESLQQPVDQLHFSCLSRVDGHLELLVVERVLVEHWMAECEALGLLPSHLWAEMQLMPAPEPDQLWRWARADDSCLKRTDGKGVQHWLRWPDVLGDVPEGWKPIDHEISGSWPSQWASLHRLPNLLGSIGRRKINAARRTLPFSKTQRGLMAACAVLSLCWGAVALGQFWQQVPVWKAQVEAVTGPVASARQAERLLSRMRADQLDWRTRQQQMVELEQAVGRWLDTQQGWGLSGSYFDGQNWRVVLHGSAPGPAEDHWQGIAQTVGAKVKVEPDTKTSLLTLHFNLDARP